MIVTSGLGVFAGGALSESLSPPANTHSSEVGQQLVQEYDTHSADDAENKNQTQRKPAFKRRI